MARVYLSGGMEYAANEGRDWRRDLQGWLERELGCSVFNPNVESERFLARRLPGVDFRSLKRREPDRFREVVRDIVGLDCREIAESTDFLICFWDEGAARGAGTKGEITIARHTGKPVYLVTSIPEMDIPGWVLGCTTALFPSFDVLKSFLLSNLRSP
jgi:hypothetical protein